MPLDHERGPARRIEGLTMKAILILLGIILIVVAAVYLLVPADALPSFMPGFDASLARPRTKHGLAAGVVGIVLFAIGWFVGRK
jgi:hypothetical protein